MKLTEIAIDGLNHSHNFRVGRFADGLNFVYGDDSAGKSTLRKFVCELLSSGRRFDTLSDNDWNSGQRPASNSLVGFLCVRDRGHEYRLDRDGRTSGELRVSLVDSGTQQSAMAVQKLMGRLDVGLYETIFNFSFQQTPINIRRICHVLEAELAVPRGSVAVGDDSAALAWKRESDARRTRLHSIQLQIEAQRRTRTLILQENENADLDRRSRLAELNRKIETVAIQINGFDIENKKNQLAKLDREISDLRILIEETIRREQIGAAMTPISHGGDPFESMYQRLDEIDNQIRRWRRVQSDIQAQRVRLKDEMVVWNDLTLESDEHPYHNAREILVSLENKVDAAERHANPTLSNNGQRDSKQASYAIQDLCKKMRDDLYGLCQELAQQYKHIRHRAAAGELKQLRRCYHEMGENTDRLVRRRESVIKEIRVVDPAGADAIQRSETGFCQCAMHEGYLEARRRFVAGSPQIASTQIVRTDLSEHHFRLESLERQRQEIRNWLVESDAELIALKSRHAQLIRDREVVRDEIESKSSAAAINRLEIELSKLTSEQNTLSNLIEEGGRYVAESPNGILKRAASLLDRLTAGELTQVWLSNSSDGEPHIRKRFDEVVNFADLEIGEQDQVYLCLAIAAKEELTARGIDMPLIIDDGFINIARDRVTPTLDMLMELGRSGHQIIVLTRHRFLADRYPGAPVFELPPSTGFTQPIATPDRYVPLPVVPVIPVREQHSNVMPQTFYDFDDNVQGTCSDSQHNSSLKSDREYPFSKYPVINDVTEYRDQMNYIVPYPGPKVYDDVVYPHGRSTTESTFQRVGPIPVEEFGDRLESVAAVDESTLLERLDLFDSPQLRMLTDLGVDTIFHLLELDPAEMTGRLRDVGLVSDQLNRWQAYVWLLSNIPGLRNSDARILVACGITEPEHLATSHVDQLYQRIQRFLVSSEGQRFAGQSPTISLERINRWYRGLELTRARWHRDGGYSRRAQRREPRSLEPSNGDSIRTRQPNRHARTNAQPPARSNSQPRRPEAGPLRYDRTPQHYEGASPDRDLVRDSSGAPRRERDRQESFSQTSEPLVARPSRMRTPDLSLSARRAKEKHPSVPPISPVVRSKFSREADRDIAEPENSNDKMRFYLEVTDHIEAAPSIGPKTAERFERIGVHTVDDFLKQTAETMAAKLKYKRITADVVRAWQHQARLVCRIPNLRGHDAQLLVACDFTEPEAIATMQPRNLFGVIGPFAKTKDGQKIIRTGKDPDLAEVTNWITWSAQTRSLQAA